MEMGGRASLTSTSSRYQYQYHSTVDRGPSTFWRGPRKIVCFCLLACVLPCVLVSVALLMRFVVHGTAQYHLSPSDMRMLDHRISTTWCQSEKVKGNATFTAYMTVGEPHLVESPAPLVIERNLVVPDDHKEYWGFYLLKGSTFRIHSCARWRGGTLLIVRGRSHLEHCAYIGESDSAGDSDQFSTSSSDEQKKPVLPYPNTINSKEEMSVILSKIRQYIRSRPKNYGKLKKNLADWMLLESSKSAEASASPLLDDQNARNVNRSTSTSSTNAAASSKLMPDVSSLRALLNEVSGNNGSVEEGTPPPFRPNFHVKSHENRDGLVLQHGTISRHRRQTEVRKDTESGENGAFEDETASGEGFGGGGPTTTQTVHPQLHHHQGVFNQTLDMEDGSNSESESSWSSSEEAMAKCEGVLTNLRILANDSCGLESDEGMGLYYEGVVNASGYYYFIFGSENEKRDNLIRARFELDKVIYELPEPIENCTNVRECKVNFRFASSQKLVVTVPMPASDLESVWDEMYLAESECLPRTSLYLGFVLTVPLVILLCAFQ